MRAASEGRLGFDDAVLFGKRHGQISLGELKLRFDLAPLDGVAGVPQLGPQLLDVLFRWSSSHLLEFVKDETAGRE